MSNESKNNPHFLESLFDIDAQPLRQHIGSRITKTQARQFEIPEKKLNIKLDE
jgi:hypothetical protein